MAGSAALEWGKAPAVDWGRLAAWVPWGTETTIPHCAVHPVFSLCLAQGLALSGFG